MSGGVEGDRYINIVCFLCLKDFPQRWSKYYGLQILSDNHFTFPSDYLISYGSRIFMREVDRDRHSKNFFSLKDLKDKLSSRRFATNTQSNGDREDFYCILKPFRLYSVSKMQNYQHYHMLCLAPPCFNEYIVLSFTENLLPVPEIFKQEIHRFWSRTRTNFIKLSNFSWNVQTTPCAKLGKTIVLRVNTGSLLSLLPSDCAENDENLKQFTSIHLRCRSLEHPSKCYCGHCRLPRLGVCFQNPHCLCSVACDNHEPTNRIIL